MTKKMQQRKEYADRMEELEREYEAEEARRREEVLRRDLASDLDHRVSSDYYSFFRGIPMPVAASHRLTWEEKILLAIVHSWGDVMGDVPMTAEEVAPYMGVTPERVARLRRSVESKGFLRRGWIVVPRESFEEACQFLKRDTVPIYPDEGGE